MKFPRRSLRLFMFKSSLKKRIRFSREEVKDVIDLSLSSNGTEDSVAEDDEEDCLTSAQLLSRSRKTKRNDRDDEPLPDVCSEIETSPKVDCMNEPVEWSGRSLSSSGKCENWDSPAETQKESEARKSALASETNHAEANNDNVELAKEQVVREANNVNGEEESHDKTASASELPLLGLKARILRLEQIFNMIKAEKKCC